MSIVSKICYHSISSICNHRKIVLKQLSNEKNMLKNKKKIIQKEIYKYKFLNKLYY